MEKGQKKNDRQNWAKAGFIEPQPGQSIVDEIAEDAGVEQEEREPLHIRDQLIARDQDRSELEPDPEENLK